MPKLDAFTRASGGVAEAVPRPHRVHGRYPKPPQTPPQFIQPQVRDFETRQALIDHARGEGATHVLVVGSGATLYYPFETAGGSVAQYEEARAWRQNGYWHVPAPGSRKVVDRLPKGAEPIESGRRAAEAPRGHTVRDYIAVDPRGRPLSKPTKDYSAAKREADQAGGFVKFATDPPGRVGEAFGRRAAWPDWQILDAIDKGNMLPPASEARAVKLAQLGFIDTTGTWRLTAKGRRTIDQRVPVAAESPVLPDAVRRRKFGRDKRLPMKQAAVSELADELALDTAGDPSKPIPGGFRWSDPNFSSVFSTRSPEHMQPVFVVVSVFRDGSLAMNFFSDASLSGTAQYENISGFTYASADFDQMIEDINWVRTTVDDYAASWQQDQPEVDERRPRPKRQPHRRSAR
jgi:hypothetical protein